MSHQQREWSVKWQRNLYKNWSVARGRYEWQDYIEGRRSSRGDTTQLIDGNVGAWVFFDTVDTYQQPLPSQSTYGQSAYDHTAQAGSHSVSSNRQRNDSGAEPGSARGAEIAGTYDAQRQIPNSHYESLDSGMTPTH